MDWNQNMTIVSGTIYCGDRWLGTLSSHSAAMAGLRLMRGDRDLVCSDCSPLTETDLDLLEAIDADEP
ncbi:hypothetical protein [Paraburkholderia sp. J11-2]|uniref:hypothetical protein n=1 Tax=Paraburkholderia sp. J11-2 TaxID=2805431 RepID=UPI002AB79DBA|nr:hypothetical protein [Paraburkholderia sp. J11-2]